MHKHVRKWTLYNIANVSDLMYLCMATVIMHLCALKKYLFFNVPMEHVINSLLLLISHEQAKVI